MIRGNYRTKQQKDILQCLEKYKNCFKSIEDLMQDLRNEDLHVGQTTMYRALERFSLEGSVLKIPSVAGQPARYCYIGKNNTDRYGRLVCLECGEVIPLKCGCMSEFAEHVLSDHHFQLDEQNTIFYAYCEECRKSQKN